MREYGMPTLGARLILILVICCPAPAADIAGRISILKKLSKQRVVLPVYQLRGVSLPAKEEEGTAADEFRKIAVYLDGELLHSGRPLRVDLEQKNGRFRPDIVVIPAGSTVSFPNLDPIFHNVFSLSKLKQFDLGYYPIGETRTVRFEKPGVVQVYCHLHSNMNAAVVIVPNAWYTIPEKDGRYSLSDVPSGKYELVAWHKSAGFFKRHVEVAEVRFDRN